MPGTRSRLWGTFAVSGTVALVVLYAAKGLGGRSLDMVYEAITLPAILGSGVLAWMQSAKALQTSHRIAWRLVAAGAFAWGLGELGWAYQAIALGRDVPTPSWIDVPYLLNLPLMVAAMLALSWHRGSTSRLGAVRIMDAALVATAIFLAGWLTVLRPLVASSGTSAATATVTLLYPLGDLLILTTLGLSLMSLDGKALRRLWALLAGVAVIALGDLGYSFVYLQTGGYGTTWFDLAWTLGAFLLGWAAIGPPLGPSPLRETTPRSEHWLPLATIVGLFPLAVWDLSHRGSFDGVTVGVGVGLGLALLGRQAFLLDLHVRLSRSLLETQRTAGLGAWEWSPRSRRMLFSESCVPLLALEPGTSSLSFGDFLLRVHPDDRPQVESAWAALADQGTPLDCTARLLAGPVPGKPLRFTGERPGAGEAFRGTFQDLTREVQLREEQARALSLKSEADRLQEINRFKTNFINTAAHELNTPLTPIKISLANLKRVEPDGRPRANTLALLERNVDRLINLLHDVLDSARLQSDKLRMELKVIDLAALAREAVEEQRLVAEEKGLRLEFDGLPCPVEADVGRVGQVMMNLLSNAVKFTKGPGQVTVDVRPLAGAAHLRVTDSGRGIEPADIERLFQPFSQVGESLQGPVSGTGLGLYIAHEVVQRMGGRIWAESQGLGQGATFHVELPLVRDVQAASAGIATA